VTVLSVGLDAACVVLTAFLAMSAIRAVRRHTALIEARSSELEQFAGRVSHDLRGPLTPVLMAVQRACREMPPDHPMHTAFARADRSLARMTALVDDLLTFARAGGAPDPDASASVRLVVDATMDETSPVAQASKVILRCEPGDDVHAACSPGVLGSLLSNLVRNAVKYIGDAAVRQVVVRWRARGQAVRVEVADTGPGLPPGGESAVFEPYVRLDQTGQGGIGLGLATVKRLAEAHHGAVGVHSSARGSVFWFELPTRPPPREPQARAQGASV
jgi:signal transduction histidine kinase